MVPDEEDRVEGKLLAAVHLNKAAAEFGDVDLAFFTVPVRPVKSGLQSPTGSGKLPQADGRYGFLPESSRPCHQW